MGIKIGIVGAGQFAQHFIPLFAAHPQVRSVLLADLDAKKCITAAEKYGVAATCATLDDVLASDVDAVALFTQHWMHGPQAIQALRAGKHVYSAVPCAASVEETEAVVRTVEATGKIYQMGETSYYYPHVCWARDQHRKGFFGDVTLLEAGYYHDWDITSIDSRGIIAARTTPGNFIKIAGSPPMHYPTHTMSQAIGVTGAHMTRVSAHGWVDRHPDGIYDPAVNNYANAFSNQTALCTMSDGAAARINEFRRVGHPGGEFMSVWGTRASLEYSMAGAVVIGHSFGDTRRLDDLFRLRPETHGGTALAQPVERLPREFAKLPNNHWGSHQFLADDFVRACITGEQPPTNIWQAARYLVPGFVAHESCKQGGAQLHVPDFGAGPK